jgi:hypothetical protein
MYICEFCSFDAQGLQNKQLIQEVNAFSEKMDLEATLIYRCTSSQPT